MVRHPGGPSWERERLATQACDLHPRSEPTVMMRGTDQSAGPPPPAVAAQSPREPGALARNARTHGSAPSVRPAGTTAPTNGSARQREALAVPQYDTTFEA